MEFILHHVPSRICLNVLQAPKAHFGFKQTKAKLCGPSLVIYFIFVVVKVDLRIEPQQDMCFKEIGLPV